MKKLNKRAESDFLNLFFALFVAAFLIAAPLMPDRAKMLSGFYRILSSPCKVSTNYFALGGYAATFLNMGLVGLMCLALYVLLDAKTNHVSAQAVILTVGFGSWGINVLNIIPTILGVWLYCAVKKERLGSHVNAMLFSTGIAPLISELALRYLHPETVGFTLPGVALAVGIGLLIGFCTPAGLVHSPLVHQGYALYSAALPVGMIAFFLQAMLYKTTAVELPAAPAAETLAVGSTAIANAFCLVLFGVMVVLALLMGGSFREYWKMLWSNDHPVSISTDHDNATFLMNVGIYGLFILAYYNIVGEAFNGVTFGILFCMLSCCNVGANPRNVFPIILGYVAAAWLFEALEESVGGNFTGFINTQSIMVGLCYASGLSPITRKYGWPFAFLGAMMHYTLVTSVPLLHGGYCLYNGGFTAALICLIYIPLLDQLATTKEERRALKAEKSKD